MLGLGIAFLVALALAAASGSKKTAPAGTPADLPPVSPGPPVAGKPLAEVTGKSGTKWLTQLVSQAGDKMFVDVFLAATKSRILRYAQTGTDTSSRSLTEAAPGVDPNVLASAVTDFGLGAPSGSPDVQAMSAALQKELADAFAALTVGTDGKIQGPVTAAGIQLATSVAGDLDRNGFAKAAAGLREYIKAASSLVPSVPADQKIPLPASMPADLQDKVNRALQLERDPAKLQAILAALQAYQPQTADLVNASHMLQALIVQVQAQQSQKDALAKIDQIVTPGGGAPPAASPTAVHYVQYQTRKGDTGSSIARDFTGDGNRWHELLAVNPTTKSAKYGMAFNSGVDLLNIPASWPPTPHGAAPIQPGAAEGVAVPTGGLQRYQTQRGDTGSSISKAFTGDPNRWRELLHVNPETASVQYGMAFNAGVKVLNIPASWPPAPGVIPGAAMASSLPDSPISVPAAPVPGPMPQPRTPVEMAADAMVRNLKAVQGQYPFPSVHGKEDQTVVRRFQTSLGTGTADGLAGPGTMLAAAVNGQSDLPLVMYWPKGSTAARVLKYRSDIQDVANRARAAGDAQGASLLEASAARDRGQGGIVGPLA